MLVATVNSVFISRSFIFEPPTVDFSIKNRPGSTRLAGFRGPRVRRLSLTVVITPEILNLGCLRTECVLSRPSACSGANQHRCHILRVDWQDEAAVSSCFKSRLRKNVLLWRHEHNKRSIDDV